MNGRIYDPELGRMISADPTIPHPHNPQSYNRYSYVMNNPSSRIDPTGFTDEQNQYLKDYLFTFGGTSDDLNPSLTYFATSGLLDFPSTSDELITATWGSGFEDMDWGLYLFPKGLQGDKDAQKNNKVGVGDFVELLGKSAAENIKSGTTLEAAFGPGAGAESAFNLNGDTDLTFTSIKGLKLEAGFHISGQAFSKGNIQGFFQGVQFCLFGCVGVNWDYGGNWNINTSLTFPISVGGGVVSGYTNTGSNIVNSLQGGN